MAACGEAVMVRCGSLRAASFGAVRRGQSWLGGQGEVMCVTFRLGAVGQGGLGMVCSGPFRGVCQGMAVKGGAARWSIVRCGMARRLC